MSEVLPAVISAFWLGILTSISPCPLATNIAAVSFLSKDISAKNKVITSGLSYVIGRSLTYMVLGVLIISSLLSVPLVASALQRYMNIALGPILILVGLVLIGWLPLRMPSFSISVSKQNRLAKSGATGALALGCLFALSFCPFSAALFFGSLIPLALTHQSLGTPLSFIYGIGTGLPVFVFAVLIALGVGAVGKWFDKVKVFELYARKVTAAVFIIVGGYYLFVYVRW